MKIQTLGLKFRDILIALGQLAADNLQGEYAGTGGRAGLSNQFHPSNRVVDFTEVSFATIGRAKSSHACEVPKNYSFAAAAALTTIY